MHKRLEKYLQTIEAQLSGLNAEQRDSELREMQQHLEAMVSRLVENGLSEKEATEKAIAQFGAARQVGRELRTANVQSESPARVLIAVLGASVVYAGFGSLQLTAFADATGVSAWLLPIMIAGLMSFWAGAFAGFIAPRRGGRALLWTVGTGCLFLIAMVFYRAMTPGMLVLWLRGFGTLVAQMALMWRGTIFGARQSRFERTKRA